MGASDIDTEKARIIETLRLGAMPGAERVEYSLEIHDGGEQAALRSYGSDGKPIGDDRPYEILKARFEPLRASAKRLRESSAGTGLGSGETFVATLDLQTDRLETAFGTADGGTKDKT